MQFVLMNKLIIRKLHLVMNTKKLLYVSVIIYSHLNSASIFTKRNNLSTKVIKLLMTKYNVSITIQHNYNIQDCC